MLRSHATLNRLEHIGSDAAVVCELFGAEFDPDASHLTSILVCAALIDILEPSPPADIIHYDRLEIGCSALDIGQQLLKARTPSQVETTAAGILVGCDDVVAHDLRIVADGILLVVDRVDLMLGRHTQILGCAHDAPT